jgi:thioredoxin-related protein
MTSHRALRVLLAILLLLAGTARAQDPAPYAIDIPPWFANTFLDLREDIADAARDGRRVMAYFGQDGCPYCKQLMVNNFSQRDIVERMHKSFVAIALNIWGDRDTTWLDGVVRPEKRLARMLDVQFTPTLLFFDEKGAIVARLNGYYPPARFAAVLDYVASDGETREPLAAYLARTVREGASTRLADEAFFMKPPYDLRRRDGKPLAVVFETTGCAACDELHREAFARSDVRAQLARYDVARFALAARSEVTTPDGHAVTAEQWARELGIAYTPSIVLFDADGREALRLDTYLRPFHVASALEYVATGAWRSEPSFQRFVQTRAERLRGAGQRVDLWQ